MEAKNINSITKVTKMRGRSIGSTSKNHGAPIVKGGKVYKRKGNPALVWLPKFFPYSFIMVHLSWPIHCWKQAVWSVRFHLFLCWYATILHDVDNILGWWSNNLLLTNSGDIHMQATGAVAFARLLFVSVLNYLMTCTYLAAATSVEILLASSSLNICKHSAEPDKFSWENIGH